ncbi:MAG: PKD domain-containing protein [Candidatus Bipolaricaulota bacterium]
MRTLSVFLAGVMIAGMAFTSLGFEADFEPSDYNPAPGGSVTFEVTSSCATDEAISYGWDFDGDGIYDISTKEPYVEYSFRNAGYTRVSLQATRSDGKRATRCKGLLVGKSPLLAVREALIEETGTILVSLTAAATTSVLPVAVQESIPIGWQVDILDAGGSLVKIEERNLQALWLSEIRAGRTNVICYRLRRSFGVGNPELGGELTGYAQTTLIVVPVCGDIYSSWESKP